MGRAPNQQAQSRSRLRSRIALVVVGAAALALVAAGCGGSSSVVLLEHRWHEGEGRHRRLRPAPVDDDRTTSSRTPAALTSACPTSPTCSSCCTGRCTGSARATPPNYNASLSVANAPTFSGNKVTITLKHYMWSDGQPVTASNVMFWINMETAEPANYGGYTGFPADDRQGHQGGQPDRADHDDGQELLAQLVPVQRAGADHADAGGVGPDRVRAEPLHHDGQRLRRLSTPTWMGSRRR